MTIQYIIKTCRNNDIDYSSCEPKCNNDIDC